MPALVTRVDNNIMVLMPQKISYLVIHPKEHQICPAGKLIPLATTSQSHSQYNPPLNPFLLTQQTMTANHNQTKTWMMILMTMTVLLLHSHRTLFWKTPGHLMVMEISC